MSISEEQLLAKIEQQIGQAKNASSAQKREHLHAIRTLCDLALDNNAPSTGAFSSVEAGRIEVKQTPVYSAPAQPVSVSQEKPVKMEDGANGDSLFDF
ncbi:YwdI family protein [Jeotgalibacillus sp. ET6]|uniref:YwdI family protein n=1 Tax=Jeotgalibacillus sp. ET6 TaxID=3037260 RepID=UPI0024183552|nr:YwdI family protein [Jeotgalibacillus sp. ET6]MDG5471100.1 YwdI family protein [Jeotgalibacillus sp. ET6]